MKKLIIMLSLALLLVVSACGNSGKIRCQDGSWVDAIAQCPEIQAAIQATQQAQNSLNNLTNQTQVNPANPANLTSQEIANTQIQTKDPRVQVILEKHNSQPIKGYSFLYAPLPENIAKNEYYYYGNKVLVKPGAINKFNADSRVDNIYLDLNSKTARGFCMSNNLAICSVKGEERPVNFNDWFIKSPIDWFNQPGLENAKKTGSKNFENFEVDILRFQYEGQYYEYLITKFWGLPVRIGIYSDPDYTQLVGGAEYRNFAVNGFKEDKVLPPN